MQIEEAESRSESGNEFVFDAMPFPQLIVILEESLDSDLFLPDFSSDPRFDIFD